ncbi:MAG: GIY-YIG nuclease family protein [Caldilineaceae bacterium]
MLALPLKQFLLIPECPPAWLHYDLYLFRDAEVVFYVGQSELAFARVWRHFHDGFKGRSLLGKFIRVNWPRSMNFIIELYATGEAQFADLYPDRLAAEARLIEQHSPCFNSTLNRTPTPLPATYRPPTATVRYPRHIRRMIQEAEAAMRQVNNVTEW